MSLKDVSDRLVLMGLSKYEARAYAALLLYGPLTASEVASKADIPQPRVYDVLNNLVDKGLVVVKEGQPKRYAPLGVQEALSSYIRREVERLERLKDEIASMLPSMQPPYTSEVGIWRSEGLSAALSMARDMMARSRYEVIVAGSWQLISSMLDDLKEAARRGVSVGALVYGATKEALQDADVEAFDEVRVTAWRGPAFVLLDQDSAVILAGAADPLHQPTGYLLSDRRLLPVIFDYVYRLREASDALKELRAARGQVKTFAHMVRAVDYVSAAMSAGLRVSVEAEGVSVRDGSPVHVSGAVSSLGKDPLRGIYFIEVVGEGGSKVRLGGPEATYEDVRALYLKVTVT